MALIGNKSYHDKNSLPLSSINFLITINRLVFATYFVEACASLRGCETASLIMFAKTHY